MVHGHMRHVDREVEALAAACELGIDSSLGCLADLKNIY